MNIGTLAEHFNMHVCKVVHVNQKWRARGGRTALAANLVHSHGLCSYSQCGSFIVDVVPRTYSEHDTVMIASNIESALEVLESERCSY